LTKPEPNIAPIFEKAFRQYKDHVYDYAVKMLGERDSAGDITQDVFGRFYNQLQNHKIIENQKNWLFIICRNLCLNNLRNRKEEIPIEQADYLKYNPADSINAATDILGKAMTTIPVNYREALILKEYKGFSYSEISDIMNLTIPAVRSVLYKARNALKENYTAIKAGRQLL